MASKFKMTASDLVSVRGQVMEYTYIPTGISKCTIVYMCEVGQVIIVKGPNYIAISA